MEEGEGNYHLDLILFKKIVPVRSKKIHLLNSIEIVMEKLDQTQQWIFLRKDGLGLSEGKEEDGNLYPTSSKTKKNWDKINR